MTSRPVKRPRQHPHVTVIKALRVGDGAMAREAIRQDIMMSSEALRAGMTGHGAGGRDGAGGAWVVESGLLLR